MASPTEVLNDLRDRMGDLPEQVYARILQGMQSAGSGTGGSGGTGGGGPGGGSSQQAGGDFHGWSREQGGFAGEHGEAKAEQPTTLHGVTRSTTVSQSLPQEKEKPDVLNSFLRLTGALTSLNIPMVSQVARMAYKVGDVVHAGRQFSRSMGWSKMPMKMPHAPRVSHTVTTTTPTRKFTGGAKISAWRGANWNSKKFGGSGQTWKSTKPGSPPPPSSPTPPPPSGPSSGPQGPSPGLPSKMPPGSSAGSNLLPNKMPPGSGPTIAPGSYPNTTGSGNSESNDTGELVRALRELTKAIRESKGGSEGGTKGTGGSGGSGGKTGGKGAGLGSVAKKTAEGLKIASDIAEASTVEEAGLAVGRIMGLMFL